MSALDNLPPPSSPLDNLAPPPAPTAPVAQADPNSTYPVGSEFGAFFRNALAGAASLREKAGMAGAQMYASAFNPSLTPVLNQQAAAQRAYYAPLQSTFAAKAGEAGIVAPLALVPGANTLVGAGLVGGGLGALQPTVGGESRGINTAVGAGLGLGGRYAGNTLASWITQRATQPVMGYTQSTNNRLLAQAVGSQAAALNQGEIGTQASRLGSIFEQGRSPNVTADLSSMPSVLDGIASKLDPSSRAAFESNPTVNDLLTHVTGPGSATLEKLGNISTGLRQDAYSALNSQGGNREVGLALGGLREHIENTIQSSIPDQSLRNAYAAARPQYGLLQDVRYNPTVLKASTGDVNMTAMGNYLQRNNPKFTSASAADNPLFRAATWGQATGQGKGAPELNLVNAIQWARYWAINNPASRLAGGVTSRALNPVSTAVPRGLQGLAFGSVPVALPYLEQ